MKKYWIIIKGSFELIKRIMILLSIFVIIAAIPVQVLSNTTTITELADNNSTEEPIIIDFAEYDERSIYIYLQAGIFDPLQIEELRSLSLSSQKEYGYYLIQFDGPVLNSWREALLHQGVAIYGYIPDFAYLVKMDVQTIIGIKDLPFIRWIGEYRPEYKISTRIIERLELTSESLASDPGDPEIRLEITNFGNSITTDKFLLTLPTINLRSVLNEISVQPDVLWIDLAPQYRIFNNQSAGVINATGVWQDHGLNGTGQIITVCDTGLDTGNLSTLHTDFNGKLLKTYTLGRPGNWSDDNIHTPFPDLEPVGGHGTHVAGSVVGIGANTGGAIKGIANGAKMVFQSTMTSNGDLAIPANLFNLFNPPYSNDNSRVHTNSWGDPLTNGDYTINSAELDLYVWNHPDMVILSSAGNIQGTTIRVTAPATAKNCITVGASENNRPDLPNYGDECDNIEELASFSLPGPCNDGRLKPDIVAPGTGILSTRSTIVEDDHYPWGIAPVPLNGLYAYAGGTSMSTPITAGGTAIIRQYYSVQHSHAPSAALVKATLLNGAMDMLPSGGTPPIPNDEEGWGRVNLSESIFPNAPKILRFEDNVTGLQTGKDFTYQFDVLDNSVPLKIMLVWSDYPSLTSALINLVNDLELNVTAPDGKTSYKGNVFKDGFSSSNDNDADANKDRNLDGYDDINNVESVYLNSPALGRYTVRISGNNIPNGPQPFAFAVNGGVDPAEILAPKDLTITPIAEGNTLDLNWIPCLSSDIVGYRIYRNGSASFTQDDLIITLVDNDIDTFPDQNLVNGQQYFYALEAFDIFDQTSQLSNIASGTPLDTLAPTLQVIYPTSGAVFGGNITIDYINCSDTVEVDFSYYLDADGDGFDNDGNTWQQIGKDTDLSDKIFWWNTTGKSMGGVGPGDAKSVIMNATAYDEAQNNCSVLVNNLTVDNTAPSAPELYTIIPNPTNRTTTYVAGKSEINATILIYLDDENVAGGSTDNAGLFNIDVELNEGQNIITAKAIDSAGNGPGASSDPQTVLRDTVLPVALSGGNRTVNEGTLVSFNGSGSYDTNPIPEYNYISEYTWNFKLIDNTPVILYGLNPTYYFDIIGNYTVTLRVADAAGNWGSDTFWIWVRDSVAPIANAGPDFEVDEDTIVKFDGSSSTDNDPAFNQTGNFTWTFEDYYFQNGSYDLNKITLYGVKVDHIFYTPGKYPATLKVTDSSGNVDTDIVQVRVQDLTKPVANGGDDRTVLQGRAVVFDASGSTDNDPEFETTANYEWRFVYHGENIVLYDKKVEFRFNRSTPQPLEITLNVEDAAGNFDVDTIKIYVLGDPLLPRVIAVSPLDGDFDVNLDTVIWAKFNEELDPTTIYRTNTTGTTGLPWLEETITVYDIHNEQVNGSIEYNPSTLTIKFIPDPGQLEYNHGYTVTLKSAITDLAGNPLDGNSNSFADPPPADDYSWVFATVSVITYPSSDEENVPVDASIRATFSGNTSDLTIANSHIILLDPIGTQVEGGGYFDNESQTVGFQPMINLEKNIKYTVILKTYTFPVNMTFEEINGNISGKYIRSDLTWEFYTETRARAGGEGDELDLNVMILWLIYLIIIIIIIIVIIIFLKRSRQEKELEPRQEQPAEEEDWSTEITSPPKPARRRKKAEDVVEWDDEVQEDWKPPVMEWKEMEAQSRSKTARATRARKPKKTGKLRSSVKKRSKRPIKPRKRPK